MNIATVKISECADVRPGFSVKGALTHDPVGTHQVIMSKHLTPGEPYRYLDAHALKITPARSVEKYRLEPGDILFMPRGVGNYAVLLEEIPRDSIVSLTFYVLRAHSHVEPEYLVWALNQPPFQDQLNAVRTGASTPMIPRKIFNELTIPLPPLAIQKKTAQLATLFGKEQRLLRQLQESTQLRQRLLGAKILRGEIQC